MAFTLDPQTEKITFGVVSDGTNDGIAIDLASQFGVSEDFNDDYSSDNWTDIGTGFGVNIPNAVMDVRGVKNSSNNASGFDLGAGNVSDTSFVLRFKFEFTSLPTVATDDSAIYLSIDSADQSVGANTVGHDALTLQIAKSATSQLTRLFPFHSNGGQVIETSATLLLADGVGPIYYIEIKRTSTTSATWTLFSDSTYTGVIATTTATIPVGITGLRHIVWRSRSDSSTGAGEIIAEIDDVQFWNAKSIPIIDSTTNWRIRYKLDITNLDDGANTTDKQLYMGLFDEDGASASDNAQDGYALLLSHDNTVSQFRVITPDNQAPRLATADATFTTTPSVTIRFIELIRDSASQTTTSIYSDATFTTLVEAEVSAGISGSDNLKYLKFMNDTGSNATGAIDGTIDDITFIDLGAPITPTDKTFDVDAVLLATVDETITVDSLLLATQSTTFIIDSIVRERTCSPWKKFSEADGGSDRVTINLGDAQGSEIPQVTVPTQVTGIKCSVASTSFQGSVRMSIATFPQSQLANGNFSTIANGDSTNSVAMNSLSGSFTDFTFLFNGAVLLPNQRYMIIFDDLINNAPGMDYKTINVTTRDYGRYAVLYQDPGSGTPPKFARILNRSEAIACDVEVVNDVETVCPIVDALIVDEATWEFREQRFSNANLIVPPNFTLGTEPPRLKVSAPTNSDGRGWIFKSFKKTDITGNSILVEGDGLQETRIRVYDGKYRRQFFGDFEPANGNDPVNPLDGIGLLGSTSANPLTTSLLLPAGSINYAGSTEEFITVMISCRQNFDTSIAELNISAITIAPFLKWNFSNPSVTTESTDAEVAFGFTRASSTQPAFMEKEFTIDACIGLFSGRRSLIGDIIIKILQVNPAGLTGLEIVTEVNNFGGLSFVGKTSRIKNWIGFLEREGVIQDDGSSPDWYRTKWTLV